MTILKLSSKGQIALPIKTRISFGLKAGSQIQLIEAEDGLSLKLNTSLFPIQDIAACAGLIKVKGTGQKRNLDDFDAADFASNV